MNFIKQNKKDMAKSETQSSGVNTICNGACINGDIIAKNDLRIDGVINGNIETSGRVVVGELGVINGDIKCNNIEIFGLVNGCAIALDSVCMKGKAKFNGDIITKHLSVEPTVLFSGFCKMGNASDTPKDKYLKKEDILVGENNKVSIASN
jgi:cytoskeletal protein CcmA (bactofilin family)